MILMWLPILVFFVGYIILCGIGSLMLLWHVEPFFSVYKQHSGVIIPHYTGDEYSLFLLILFGGPICLAFGYGIILVLLRKFNFKLSLKTDLEFPAFLANGFFYLALAQALRSLYFAGAFSNIYSWSNYSDWVSARWSLFASLSFFEFVNIYMFLPTLAAIVLVSPSKSIMLRVLRWLPMVLAVGVDLLLFQKKTVILTALLCFGGCWIKGFLKQPKHAARNMCIAIGAGLLVVFVYLLISWIPYYSFNYEFMSSNNDKQKKINHVDKESLAKELGFKSQQKSIESVAENDTYSINVDTVNTESKVYTEQAKTIGLNIEENSTAGLEAFGSESVDPKVYTEQAKTINLYTEENAAAGLVAFDGATVASKVDTKHSKEMELRSLDLNRTNHYEVSPLEYTFFTLLSRTPGPAMFYPVVFPNKVPFFRFDFGQDILGFGTMPDENRIIWHAMYPDMDGGSAAPINFVFYSQGGLRAVFLGMLAVGALIGLCWHLIIKSEGALNLRSLLGIVLVLFSLHLTIDSLRNTFIVSYGFFWSGFLIFALYFSLCFMRRLKPVLKNFLLKHRAMNPS